MRSKVVAGVATMLAMFALGSSRAQAIPIFAQRYHLQCGACHSVLPELNSFGVNFRERGYRLPIAKHGTSGLAVRYQLEWERDVASNQRRFTPGGVLLTDVQIGQIDTFVHYNLGAGGGPSAPYLAFVTYHNEQSQSLYRVGLQELPLLQSPGQRLDDLAPYGYYATRVGLNDLTLAAPRWGLHAERDGAKLHLNGNVSFSSYAGSAYGGKPIDTGEHSSFSSPELFLSASVGDSRALGGAALIAGARRIAVGSSVPFTDPYQRYNVFGRVTSGKAELQAEQWWGNDDNGDGAGNKIFSSGGYIRLKYYPTRHAYLGVRYDAQATPVIARDFVYYAALHVTPHARFLVQVRQPPGQRSALGAALTVGFPWPANL